jgi:hypothetical protein
MQEREVTRRDPPHHAATLQLHDPHHVGDRRLIDPRNGEVPSSGGSRFRGHTFGVSVPGRFRGHTFGVSAASKV